MLKLKGSYIAKGKYLGKTKFDFWNNIEVGDVLNISLHLSNTGIYTNTVCVECRGVKFESSINIICNYLTKISLVENGG